ncbi:MAG TPA: 3-oxoacyl-[acyl-carrier-protein] reductase, partial [Thermoanaerobacterales bacterium]|nr:3-oxoacyl-[acyl-carrier-protein] reductase [Thermoanaerobacterales bacterium]
GGSGGIGESICLEMAKQGAIVIINYNSNKQSALEIAQKIGNIGFKSEIYKADVSDLDQVIEMVNSVYKKFGKIDILVNCAGITRDNLLMRMSEKQWDDVITTNLNGVFNTSKATVRYMIKQRYGRIINISSIVGIYGNPGQTNYAAAKAGIIGFTKALAKEVGSRQITVNSIAPGFIKTKMTEFLADKTSLIEERIALRRLGKPEDVANLAVFLASEEAGYITGQVIAVDGGLAL